MPHPHEHVGPATAKGTCVRQQSVRLIHAVADRQDDCPRCDRTMTERITHACSHYRD